MSVLLGLLDELSLISVGMGAIFVFLIPCLVRWNWISTERCGIHVVAFTIGDLGSIATGDVFHQGLPKYSVPSSLWSWLRSFNYRS